MDLRRVFELNATCIQPTLLDSTFMSSKSFRSSFRFLKGVRKPLTHKNADRIISIERRVRIQLMT